MPFESRQYTTEHNPRFVTCEFYTCIIDCSILIKTTKIAYHLKSNEVTVASISLTDELVILVIFVNNVHFANTVTMGKVSHADKMRMQTLRGQGFGAI